MSSVLALVPVGFSDPNPSEQRLPRLLVRPRAVQGSEE